MSVRRSTVLSGRCRARHISILGSTRYTFVCTKAWHCSSYIASVLQNPSDTEHDTIIVANSSPRNASFGRWGGLSNGQARLEIQATLAKLQALRTQRVSNNGMLEDAMWLRALHLGSQCSATDGSLSHRTPKRRGSPGAFIRAAPHTAGAYHVAANT